MARCPSCDDALTTTQHEGVMLRLCNACGGTWATEINLEDLHGGPVTVEPLTGKAKTKHRCATCQLPLSRAKLDGRLDVEWCGTCHSAFLAEGQLSKFRPPKSKGLKVSRHAGTFNCAKCKTQFPLGQGTVMAAGLVCRKCAGFDALDDQRAERDAAQAFVDWVAGHRLLFFGLLGLVMAAGIIFAEIAWGNFLGGLLDRAVEDGK